MPALTSLIAPMEMVRSKEEILFLPVALLGRICSLHLQLHGFAQPCSLLTLNQSCCSSSSTSCLEIFIALGRNLDCLQLIFDLMIVSYLAHAMLAYCWRRLVLAPWA